MERIRDQRKNGQNAQFRRVNGSLNTPMQKYQSISSTAFLRFPVVTHATSFFSATTFRSSPSLDELTPKRSREDCFRNRLISHNHSTYKGNLNYFRCSQAELTHPQAIRWSISMHLTSSERDILHLARPLYAACQPWRWLLITSQSRVSPTGWFGQD